MEEVGQSKDGKELAKDDFFSTTFMKQDSAMEQQQLNPQEESNTFRRFVQRGTFLTEEWAKL